LVTLGASVPLTVVALRDPNVPGHFPSCPFRALLGIDCPGCGSLRALHDLTHGNVLGALDHNALLFLVLPLLLVEAFRWVAGLPSLPWLARRHTPLLVLAVVVAWTVVRNLPVFPFDVLGSGVA
jgi:hypothetical protein